MKLRQGQSLIHASQPESKDANEIESEKIGKKENEAILRNNKVRLLLGENGLG